MDSSDDIFVSRTVFANRESAVRDTKPSQIVTQRIGWSLNGNGSRPH